MIIGKVNSIKQAVVSLELSGSDGQKEILEAVIDTGYDGYLSVTPSIAARLQLPFRETRTYELGSGELFDFPVHDVAIQWDGDLKIIASIVTEGGVLIGMSLLSGYTLFIDATYGGVVQIDSRP